MKTKGEIEDALEKLKIKKLGIFRPGLIYERNVPNKRGEWFWKRLPFI